MRNTAIFQFFYFSEHCKNCKVPKRLRTFKIVIIDSVQYYIFGNVKIDFGYPINAF